MAEQAPKLNHEELKSLNELEKAAEHMLPTAEQAEALRDGEQDPAKALAEARQEIDKASGNEKRNDPIEKLQLEQETALHVPKHGHINRDLKKVTLQRELTQIRRHLTKSERALSKVIHQPVVRAVSEASSKTISRPSGLLGGGVLAFLGTSGYLLLAKNQGFSRYNYAIFLILFLAGFVIGMILELIVWTAMRSRHQAKYH